MIAIVTKTDLVEPDRVGAQLLAVAELGDWAEVVPVRRRPGSRSTCSPTCWSPGCRRGRTLYPEGELTDEPEATLVAELIREAALEGVRDELPHSHRRRRRGDGAARRTVPTG